MVKLLSGLLVVLLATATLPVEAQERHQDLFRAGLRAYDLGFWREALLYFEAAADAQPVAEGSVRQYGMWSVPYQPYYYQCLALIELGLYVEALRVLEVPEAGLVPREGGKISRHHRHQIRKLTEEIRRRLHLDTVAISRGAAEDQATIRALFQRGPEPPWQGHGSTPPPGPLFEVDGLLDVTSIEELLEASDSLRDDSLLASAEQLAAAREILERSREAIEEIHQRLLRYEQEAAQRAGGRPREQLEDALLRLSLASTHASKTRCSPLAIEWLEELDLEGWQSLSPSPEELVYPRARLLRAYIDCGWFSLARVLLEQEYEEQTLPAELLQEIERTLESAEAGTSPEEAGTSSEEAGTSSEEAGTFPEEAGTFPEEAGTSPEVAGTSPEVAGTSPEVAGTSGTAEIVPAADFFEMVVASRLGSCQGQILDRRLEELAPRLVQVDPATLSRLGIEEAPSLVGARDAWACEDPERLGKHLDALGPEIETLPEARDLGRWLSQQRRLGSGGHALLVAVSDYSSAPGWPTLRSPRSDIREVARALEAHGFEIETLEDPTFETLQETLDSFFFRHGNDPENRLVFYYAGHGHTEQTRHGVKLGFLVPVDAGDPRAGREHLRHLFGMERFREYAIRSNATDMLFMFDSCFAGTVFRATRSCLPPACDPAASGLGLSELIARPVRMFLTAGDETQRVPDQSLFRSMVTRALAGEGDLDRDRWILGRELGSFVQERVQAAQQRLEKRFLSAGLGQAPATPQWGTLAEAEFGQGDLAFRTPAEREPSLRSGPRTAEERKLALELRYWRAARASGRGEDLDRLLLRFPGGTFSALARSWPTAPQ